MSQPLLFTGLSDFDALAGPLPRGRVTLVAGRSSAGSSTFTYAATRNAITEGKAVMFVTLQVTSQLLTRHLMAGMSATNVDRPETLNEGRKRRLKQAGDVLKSARFWTWMPTINEMEPARFKEKLNPLPGLDLLVVDDFRGVVHRDGSPDATFRMLEEVAEQRNLAVLTTVPLQRPDWGYEQLQPSLDDLLVPGVFEAKTAVVLHRHDYPHAAPNLRDRVDLIAERGWQKEGKASVRFDPEYHRMVDLPNM